MSTWNATNSKSPCFQFERVQAAHLPILVSPEFPTPLLFAEHVPFYINIPLVQAVGSGCDGTGSCWSKAQQEHTLVPEGPALTEVLTGGGSTQIVTTASTNKAVYWFESYSPVATDGYDAVGSIILIGATQGSSTGYLQIHSSQSVENNVAQAPFYAAEIVPKTTIIANKSQWGVVGRGGNNANCMLMYTDVTLAGVSVPLLQVFGWNDRLYFGNGGQSGTYGAYHGVTSATTYAAFMPVGETPAIANANIRYVDTTMTMLPGALPDMDTTATDNGAANLQWSLVALPLTTVSASAYLLTACAVPFSGQCVSGMPVCAPWGCDAPAAKTCQAVAKSYPTLAAPAFAGLCNIDSTTGKPFPKVQGAVLLATPDCACMNPTQSTYAEPLALNKTYVELMAWAGEKNFTALTDAPAKSWWPACGNPNSKCMSALKTVNDATASTIPSAVTQACTLSDTRPSSSATSKLLSGDIAGIVLGSIGGVLLIIIAVHYFTGMSGVTRK